MNQQQTFAGTMIDTVKLSVYCDDLTAKELHDDHQWKYTFIQHRGRTQAWANYSTELGMELGFMAQFQWLSVTASLPTLVTLDDKSILTWPEVQHGLETAYSLAQDAVGQTLPPLPSWNLREAVVAASWYVDSEPYIAATRLVSLPYSETVNSADAVSWLYPSGKKKAALRCVKDTLRLERHTDGWSNGVLPTTIGEVERRCAEDTIAETMSDLGLSQPIRSSADIERRLRKHFGSVKGTRLFERLLGAKERGGAWPADMSRWTQRRIQRDLQDAGIIGIGWDAELPALPMPR